MCAARIGLSGGSEPFWLLPDDPRFPLMADFCLAGRKIETRLVFPLLLRTEQISDEGRDARALE
jgi:hypothetical protein